MARFQERSEAREAGRECGVGKVEGRAPPGRRGYIDSRRFRGVISIAAAQSRSVVGSGMGAPCSGVVLGVVLFKSFPVALPVALAPKWDRQMV